MMNLNEIQPAMLVPAQYSQLGDREKSELALSKLNRYVDEGRMRSARVVEAILNEQPRDRYVRARALRLEVPESHLRVAIGESDSDIHLHALDQIAQRVGLNSRYLHDLLRRGSDWATRLVATNLNELLGHQGVETRYLVREVNGRIRGVLSDAYKCIDSRPTLESIIGAAQQAAAIIVDGTYTETRVSLKVIRARPVEVFPGEWMVFGLDYSNSDFGDGASEFAAFLLRLLCLNGAVTVKEMRKVHIGRRYSADDAASDRTLRLDAATQASLARDQVGVLLSDGATDKLVEQIRRANGTAVQPKDIEGFLRSRTSKGEAARDRGEIQQPRRRGTASRPDELEVQQRD